MKRVATMSREQQRRRDGLATASVAFFVIAIAELIMVTVPEQGGGANIGLPFALLAVVLTGAAVGLTRSGGADSPGPAIRLLAGVALVAGALVMLFVGYGILEDLGLA